MFNQTGIFNLSNSLTNPYTTHDGANIRSAPLKFTGVDMLSYQTGSFVPILHWHASEFLDGIEVSNSISFGTGVMMHIGLSDQTANIIERDNKKLIVEDLFTPVDCSTVNTDKKLVPNPAVITSAGMRLEFMPILQALKVIKNKNPSKIKNFDDNIGYSAFGIVISFTGTIATSLTVDDIFNFKAYFVGSSL